MNIAVIGAGYVGLTISAWLADRGHRVVCVEIDRERMATIQQGRIPFYEPGLSHLVASGMRNGTLSVTDAFAAAVNQASLIFIAVGTPSRDDGEADLTALDEVIQALTSIPLDDKILAIKSTVTVGTTDRVGAVLAGGRGQARVAYTPEFMSQGSALADVLHPHRIIIGTRCQAVVKVLLSLYQPLPCPILVTDPPTAEMIKSASNAFLATRVSFINQIAMICEQVGVDVATTAVGMGLDPRIGQHFLRAGIGFGGSCLPKDIRALVALARRHATPSTLLDAVLEVNVSVRRRFVDKVDAILNGIAGKTLAALGLAFKGRTSDIRESPAVEIVRHLLARGAVIRAFDPAAENAAARVAPGLVCCPDPYEAAEGADAIVILSDWPEFEALDWKRLGRQVRGAVVIDGRGLHVAAAVAEAGFTYIGPRAQASPHILRDPVPDAMGV